MLRVLWFSLKHANWGRVLFKTLINWLLVSLLYGIAPSGSGLDSSQECSRVLTLIVKRIWVVPGETYSRNCYGVGVYYSYSSDNKLFYSFSIDQWGSILTNKQNLTNMWIIPRIHNYIKISLSSLLAGGKYKHLLCTYRLKVILLASHNLNMSVSIYSQLFNIVRKY